MKFLQIGITRQGNFAVFVPSETREQGGHTIFFPVTEAGAKGLAHLLKRREEYGKRNPSGKAMPGMEEMPLQTMVDEWLKTNSITKPAPKPKAPKVSKQTPADEIVVDLGELDLSKIELDF